MAITIDIPKDLEDELRAAGDVEETAREALLISLYRQGRISAGRLADILGLPTSLAALDWLFARGEPINYGVKEFEEDIETHKRLRQEGKL